MYLLPTFHTQKHFHCKPNIEINTRMHLLICVYVFLGAMRKQIFQNLTTNWLATFQFNPPKQRFIRYFKKYKKPNNVQEYHLSIRVHFNNFEGRVINLCNIIAVGYRCPYATVNVYKYAQNPDSESDWYEDLTTVYRCVFESIDPKMASVEMLALICIAVILKWKCRECKLCKWSRWHYPLSGMPMFRHVFKLVTPRFISHDYCQ
jgi:hypothetical protein